MKTQNTLIPIQPSLFKSLVTICCFSLMLFLLTVGFSIMLSASKLNTFTKNSTLSTYTNIDEQTKIIIERGIRFGRPLDGFIGLNEQLNNVVQLAEKNTAHSSIQNSVVLNTDNEIVASAFPISDKEKEELLRIRAEYQISQQKWIESAHSYFHITSLYGKGEKLEGYLITQLLQEAVSFSYTEFMKNVFLMLLGLIVFLLLTQCGWIAYFVTVKKDITSLSQSMKKVFVTFIGASQVIFIAFMLYSFAVNMQNTSKENAQISAAFLAQNLEILISKHVDISQVSELQNQLQELTRQNKEIQSALIEYNGKVIAEYGAKGQEKDKIEIAFSAFGTDRYTLQKNVGFIALWLDKNYASNVFKILSIDQLTALIISFLLLLQLSNLTVTIGLRPILYKTLPSQQMNQADTLPIVMSSLIFFFFFASDMVLSFVPIVAGMLPGDIPFVSERMYSAFPTTVEALFAGIGIMCASVLNLKFGWKKVLLLSIIISLCSAFLGAVAQNIMIFVIARAGSGFGFAMALMAAQLSIIENKKSSKSQVSGLASLYAGLFAGSLCGSAGGGMAYELFGRSALFFVAGVFFLIPLAMILLLPKAEKLSVQASENNKTSFKMKELFSFLTSYKFLMPVLLLSFPSSMMLTGFIYYLVPTQLESIGIEQGDIGRLFMLHSLCFVLIGPIIAKLAEKTKNLRVFVSGIGFTAGFSMLSVFLFPSYFGYALGCILTGISNSMMSSSMMVYILSLPSYQELDEGIKGSSYRICERVAQIIGPMLFSTFLLYLGSSMFFVIGAVFCGGSIVFIILSSSKSVLK